MQAARQSRADLLLLGDSVVFSQGHGWDAGFIQAGSEIFGLAGTGLVDGFGGEGEGYSINPYHQSNWSADPGLLPESKHGFRWRNRAYSAASMPIGGYGAYVVASPLDPNAAYDWHLWTAAPEGGGSFSAFRRTAKGYARISNLPPVTVQTPAEGLAHTVLSFPTNNVAPGAAQEMLLENATNVTVFYSRLLRPGAKGITVSSWGYGGHSTLDFLTDMWQGQGMSAAGRAQWFSALTDGGSGKLNVVIIEGFNDRNETTPSVNNIGRPNSPEAFADNMKALVGTVRSDWIASGKDPDDLSFTLVATYKDYWEQQPDWLLGKYAAELEKIARTDPSISFIDLYSMAPDWNQANALGYMLDTTHLSREGAMVYSRMILDAMVLPEPSCLLLGRRRGDAAAPPSPTVDQARSGPLRRYRPVRTASPCGLRIGGSVLLPSLQSDPGPTSIAA